MKTFFNFVEMTKGYMFKVGLSRFIRIQAKLTIYFITFK
jgi:hypothetical protein